MTTLTWKGISIDTLSREELLEALRYSINKMQQDREWHRAELEMERLFEDTRLHLQRKK